MLILSHDLMRFDASFAFTLSRFKSLTIFWCKVQLTDFENAAFTVFSVLVSRVILAFDLNLYIPISLVDENMERAHSRDAVNSQKFWWR